MNYRFNFFLSLYDILMGFYTDLQARIQVRFWNWRRLRWIDSPLSYSNIYNILNSFLCKKMMKVTFLLQISFTFIISFSFQDATFQCRDKIWYLVIIGLRPVVFSRFQGSVINISRRRLFSSYRCMY